MDFVKFWIDIVFMFNSLSYKLDNLTIISNICSILFIILNFITILHTTHRSYGIRNSISSYKSRYAGVG
mgnify:CR=1 FL=1